ncbi:MAG: Bax inhibitor-1/YccA family protein [Bacteroidaceae bacterium]
MEKQTIINSYEQSRPAAFATLFKNVYLWMTFALVVTGMTAAYIASNEQLATAILANRGLFFGLLIAELALVWILSSRIMTMSFATAGMMFAAYSVLNGATMSVLFLAYTMESIATTFFITAGTFGTMAVVGYTTKTDLSSYGKMFLMALIGLIIASVVNIFMQSTMLYWIISYVGVLIFVALTAYDTQKIKMMLIEHGGEVNEQTQKLALLGSLTLYLDFINLFIYMLRIFGDRK